MNNQTTVTKMALASAIIVVFMWVSAPFLPPELIESKPTGLEAALNNIILTILLFVWPQKGN